MNLAYKESYTSKDHYLWEGDWELIRGEAYALSPSATFNHQKINGKFFRQLDE